MCYRTVFASSYFAFEGNLIGCKIPGVYIRRGDLTKRFFPLRVCEEGLIFGGACFLNFTLFAKPTD